MLNLKANMYSIRASRCKKQDYIDNHDKKEYQSDNRDKIVEKRNQQCINNKVKF